MRHVELTAEDQFLVVACDGLWDVIDPPLAMRIVLQQLAAHGRGAEGAQMAADEVKHAVDAQKAGAAELPGPVKELMRTAARVMTTTAHYI